MKPPAHSTPGLLHTTSVIVSVMHADTDDDWYLCLTWYPSLHSVELYLPGRVGSHKGVGEGQEEGTIKGGADLDYVLVHYTRSMTIPYLFRAYSISINDQNENTNQTGKPGHC